MDRLTLEARLDNLDEVLSFIDERLEKAGCPVKTQMQLDVAVEEIYVNIAHYAYTPGSGMAEIGIDISGDPLQAEIEFIDSGVEFDPLKKPDPDVTLSAAERQIGGLGIYMVKKSMDHVSYKREDGKNIFVIKKILQ